MTIYLSRRTSSSRVSKWNLDEPGSRLFVEFPERRVRGLSLKGAQGAVDLREEGLVGSRFWFRLPSRSPEAGAVAPEGCVFQGSAVRRGAEGEMVFEGQLRVGDRLDPITLAVIPTRYHRRGDTEYLDLDVSGPLPSGRWAASRVEGRLRICRPSPAA